MDQDMKKKLVLGVVAVFALGAASYFVFVGGPNQSSSAQENRGPAVRKVREPRPTTVEKNRKPKRPRKAPGPTTAARKDRPQREVRTAERKTKRNKGKRIKKKDVKPMG